MPPIDDQLRRALREAAPRPTTSGLGERLARRRRAHATRKRIGNGMLAFVVLAGTVVSFVALTRRFADNTPPGGETPTPTVSPTSSTNGATQLAGVPFAVCRVSSTTGDFGGDMDTAWVFEEENMPGTGCEASEGFQHLAVGTGGRVEVMTGRLTDVLNDDAWRVWAYAAPDLNGDGTDEIAIARAGEQPRTRHLWLFTFAGGRLAPVVEDCGPACRPVAWDIEIGPVAHENGAVTDSGLYCGPTSLRTDDRDGVVYWQAAADDRLHISFSYWFYKAGTLQGAGDSEAIIFADPSRLPFPSGLDELCGSPVSPSPYPSVIDGSSTTAIQDALCDVQSKTGDLDGDGLDDLVFVGMVPGSTGCGPDGRHVLGVDLANDGTLDLEDRDPRCDPWCTPYAIADVNADDIGELLVLEGHLASPVSGVVGVYEFRHGGLDPITFPDGENRFPLQNSDPGGYLGAYCAYDKLVLWEATNVGADLFALVSKTYRLEPNDPRFVLVSTDRAPEPGAVPKVTGWAGPLCGVEVGPLG